MIGVFFLCLKQHTDFRSVMLNLFQHLIIECSVCIVRDPETSSG